MIHFTDFGNATSVYAENNVNKLIIPLSLDTMANCQLYRSLSQKYPDLDEKFIDALGQKIRVVGDFVKVQVESGHIIYFMIIRNVEKFQPYILDITKTIDKVMNNIIRDGREGAVLFPMPTGDDLRLSDSIFIPAITNSLIREGIEVFILSNGDHEQYIDMINGNTIFYKKDSWKSDWMLNQDDIIFVSILQQVIVLCHDFKLNKTNLLKCYKVACSNGMFPKIEWYETHLGPFFKMFLPKSNSLINHGLLLNTAHYSNAEPKKFSSVIGPYASHLFYIAYSIIARNSDKIQKIANDIKIEHIKSYQNRFADQPDRHPTKPETPIL